MKNYYNKYINSINKNIRNFDQTKALILEKKIKIVKKKNKKIIFLGNGGSASLSNHFSIDITKNLNIKTQTYNESIITCLANDFGFDMWMKKALEFNLDKNDIVIFTSSSGNSKNHLNAAKYCQKKNFFSVSFTGFGDNSLSKLTNLSFIVNSKNYNIIENTHSIWMLMIVDRLNNFRF